MTDDGARRHDICARFPVQDRSVTEAAALRQIGLLPPRIETLELRVTSTDASFTDNRSPATDKGLLPAPYLFGEVPGFAD